MCKLGRLPICILYRQDLQTLLQREPRAKHLRQLLKENRQGFGTQHSTRTDGIEKPAQQSITHRPD